MHFKTIFNTCPSPLAGGQTVILADVPTYPAVIVPKKKYQKLDGFVVNLFRMLAQYFQFTPKILLTKGGKFFPGNGTFSPGKDKEVSS